MINALPFYDAIIGCNIISVGLVPACSASIMNSGTICGLLDAGE